MRTRLIVTAAASAAFVAAGLLSRPLDAQAPKAQSPKSQAPQPAAAAKPWTPPRMADGHPDLQGMYDLATMTPVDRPTEFGTRAVMTPEEAKAAEQYEAQRQVKNDAPLAPDRGAPPV